MLEIFGRGSRSLRLTTAPEKRYAAARRDYWPMINFCWRYLVGAHAVLGYLGWDPPDQSTGGGHALWIRRDPVRWRRDRMNTAPEQRAALE